MSAPCATIKGHTGAWHPSDRPDSPNLRESHRAVQVLAATAALDQAIGRILSPAEQAVYEQLVAASRAELNDAVFEAARLKGRAMTFDQAVAYALERSGSTR